MNKDEYYCLNEGKGSCRSQSDKIIQHLLEATERITYILSTQGKSRTMYQQSASSWQFLHSSCCNSLSQFDYALVTADHPTGRENAVFVTVKVFNNQVITTVTSYNNHSMWNFE
jgi:hypothetical protein